MFDLKTINSVLAQLEEERGIPKERVLEAIEAALATAYKKEYGKRGQIVNAHFNAETGDVEFEQVKIVVDESTVRILKEGEEESDEEDLEDERPRFNPEHHILIEDARHIKRNVELGEEMVFPLENKEDYGRISAQTAKQVIIQKIREAEKVSVMGEYSDKEGDIVSGTVQRIERGNVYIDLGRATGILPYEEQIPTERFRQGERIRGLLYSVEETPRGIFLRISRARNDFLHKLFEIEAPEIASGVVEIKAIAREPGSRSKIAVMSHDEYIDPVGSCVGQRGVRVSTVMSELGGEKIDVIEWSEMPEYFVEAALSPAQTLAVKIDNDHRIASVLVSPDQQSLAIGKGGQNARLAAKLTGYKIDIRSADEEGGEEEQIRSKDDTIEGTLQANSTQSMEDDDDIIADAAVALEDGNEEVLNNLDLNIEDSEVLASEALDDSPVDAGDATEPLDPTEEEDEEVAETISEEAEG